MLKKTIIEVMNSISPLVAVVCVLQFAVVKAPLYSFILFLAGSAMAAVGMVLFFIGIEVGIIPMGRFLGSELPQKGSLLLIASVAFFLGFVTTVAEPDVLVLSDQVDFISGGTISGDLVMYVMALGVGIFVSLAMLRIVAGFRMTYLLTASYLLIIALSFFTPAEFVPLAYDAGSVTTGALTAPVVIALALGFSSVLAGRSNVSDGFGLLGLASIGPIIAVMIIGILMR